MVVMWDETQRVGDRHLPKNFNVKTKRLWDEFFFTPQHNRPVALVPLLLAASLLHPFHRSGTTHFITACGDWPFVSRLRLRRFDTNRDFHSVKGLDNHKHSDIV